MLDPSLFVVSTGRCGSTALSNALRLHPDVLSLSELFAFVDVRFPPDLVTGTRLWEVLGAPNPRLSWVFDTRLCIDEVLFQPSESTRFALETGVPPLLVITLPHLSDDPESLYDEIGRWAVEQPPRPLADHFRALFGWLCQHLGRRVWVERSGLSLPRLPILAEAFPEARFLHLYRDGRDVAASMSRHHGFRRLWMTGTLERALRPDAGPPPSRGRPPRTAAAFDVDRLLAVRVPVADMGRFWSDMIVQSRSHLDRLAPDRVSELRYEDLVAEPEAQLRRLAGLLGFSADERWVRRAATLLRPRPHAWTELPAGERRQLEEAVAPGMRLLYGASPRS